ncbi:class I SAM-dependent methyltransferase [Pseudoxanthomonas jiangsuensis]|uniref:class I SAM-dependent methyltransferase n=1 Tax=Pseudoxanthomonas jiangsuensis TaxID=619688 RepID=UPI001391F6D8|nr:class I SAM-dependent methyltransferase [Pseudoxanthomonas jiangsuensis]
MIAPSELYRRLAATAPCQPTTNYWRAIELDAVQRHGQPASRVLDLGCGDGKLTLILMDALGNAHNRDWVGLDPDPEETRFATETGIYSKIHTCGGDVVPEPDASFDLGFSNSVLEHIPDIESIFREMSRLLVIGGRFVFTVPSSIFYACLKGAVLGRKSSAYLSSINAPCAYLRYSAVDEWERMLAKVRISLVGSSEYLSQKQVRWWGFVSNASAGLLYRLRGSTVRPIEIQRSLRMRSEKVRPVDRIAALLARLTPLGAGFASVDTGSAGCSLIEARKD